MKFIKEESMEIKIMLLDLKKKQTLALSNMTNPNFSQEMMRLKLVNCMVYRKENN